jgi:hypothetical protein
MKKPTIRQEAKSIEQRRRHRECGSCTACCTVMGVIEIGKPYNVPCQHVCPGGCSIYMDRPQECRDWECQWRMGVVEGMKETRPDVLGAMINYDISMRAIEVWLLREMSAEEMARIRRIAENVRRAYEGSGIAQHIAIFPARIDMAVGYPVDRSTYPVGGSKPGQVSGVVERRSRVVEFEKYTLVPTTAA